MIETLSMLVHADAKVGKTSLAATAPPPILAMDAEGGWKFIPARMRDWDPMREAPPRYDGTWDICHVMVRDWYTVGRVYDWLATGQHDFRSLCVDSISEIQRRLKQNLTGLEAPKIQHWGEILNYMDSTIRGFRDLTLHPTRPLQVVVFIAETRQNNNGKWVPYMQGQISISLPYWVDICGYLFTQPVPDANGQPSDQLIRRLLISPNAQFEAGERVQGRLGGIVDNPDVTRMLLQVFPQLYQQWYPEQSQTS